MLALHAPTRRAARRAARRRTIAVLLSTPTLDSTEAQPLALAIYSAEASRNGQWQAPLRYTVAKAMC